MVPIQPLVTEAVAVPPPAARPSPPPSTSSLPTPISLPANGAIPAAGPSTSHHSTPTMVDSTPPGQDSSAASPAGLFCVGRYPLRFHIVQSVPVIKLLIVSFLLRGIANFNRTKMVA